MGLFTKTSTKGVKFASPGTKVIATITGEGALRQMTEFQSTELAFWDKEKQQPKMQIVLPVLTNERDATDPSDNGSRSLYVPKSSRLFKALQAAIVKSGSNDIEVGGTLTITFTGYDAGGKNPQAKTYDVVYVPPVEEEFSFPASGPSADAIGDLNSLLDGDVLTLTPKQAETAKTLLAMGTDASQIATALKVPVEAITALHAA
jgi:hypothetical protein